MPGLRPVVVRFKASWPNWFSTVGLSLSSSDGPQPNSDHLQPSSDDLQPSSLLLLRSFKNILK